MLRLGGGQGQVVSALIRGASFNLSSSGESSPSSLLDAGNLNTCTEKMTSSTPDRVLRGEERRRKMLAAAPHPPDFTEGNVIPAGWCRETSANDVVGTGRLSQRTH